MRVPCLAALTSVFGALSTSISWKDEDVGDDNELKAEKVILTRPGRVLLMKLTLEGLVRVVLLVISSVSSVLIVLLGSRHKRWFTFFI